MSNDSGLRSAVEKLAHDLCAYDIAADPVPDGVESPDDYERGMNDAGLLVHLAIRAADDNGNRTDLDDAIRAFGFTREELEHDSGADGMTTHMQLPNGGCTCQSGRQ